jgi:hypothetical protein
MSDDRILGKLSYEISPEALSELASSGRLLEFANTVAASAAREIHAQIVNQVAEAAVSGSALKAGLSVSAANIFDGGDFGTTGPHGPRPHVGVSFGGGALSQVVNLAAVRVQER